MGLPREILPIVALASLASLSLAFFGGCLMVLGRFSLQAVEADNWVAKQDLKLLKLK